MVSAINGKISSIKSKGRLFQTEMVFSKIGSILNHQKYLNGCVPSNNKNVANLQLPEHIKLADPSCEKAAKIDILNGAEKFYEILEADKYKISQLIIQNIVFSYTVSGTLKSKYSQQVFGVIVQTAEIMSEKIFKNAGKLKLIRMIRSY